MGTELALTQNELETLEQRVRSGLQSFVEVGNALHEISSRQGYKLRGFESFDEYCEKTLGFSRRQGYRMIAAAQTVKKVEEVVGEAPRNEAAARELTKVAEQPKVLTKVVAKLEKQGLTVATATAERIAEAVRVVTAPKESASKASGAATAEPAVKAAALPTITDVCPGCGKAPAGYFNTGSVWRCGQCDAVVIVSVLSAAPETCRVCGHAIVGGAVMCNHCGEVLA